MQFQCTSSNSVDPMCPRDGRPASSQRVSAHKALSQVPISNISQTGLHSETKASLGCIVRLEPTPHLNHESLEINGMTTLFSLIGFIFKHVKSNVFGLTN